MSQRLAFLSCARYKRHVRHFLFIIDQKHDHIVIR